ncbi:MAG: protein kinase, partial [Phycisphaerales bacterium]|nr:protein kinase [Phycisphaerales bacterium]
MEPDRNKLRAIFDEVFQAPPEARPALLAERCADDDELRRRVEALIEIADSDDPFLANPTVAIPRIPRDQERVPLLSSSADDEVPLLLSSAGDQAPNASPASPRQPNNADDHASTLAASPITETAGVRVGRYKLLQQIGEGGFGTVFMAEQERPVRRRVALKIIKLGMDTRQVVARFEAERQALALMDHPHIARVLDAGATDSGRPFFVMEYVVGDPITNFADAHKLDVRQRLDLFAQVCQAVQHAHTKGVIHRDLKPHNVLVSMSDGRPFAKVIDFGIAKATGARLTDKTFFTEHRQLIGTPEYMSPEQAEGSPDIDTRTDVYALGVLLYELLTGATPFDAKRLRSAAFAEMQRIIKEEEPPAPSVRLSRSLETLAETAAARQAEPDKLSGLVRGELDWIVMKALDKDRARRYESPNQLAADVMRHLAGEAVVAAPPGVGYRVRKFVRRNRGAVLTGAFVTLILICSTLVMAIFYRRAELARQGEASQRAIADKQRQAAELEAYAANISEAQMAMAANKWPEAKDKLNQCPAAFQSWEWQLLKLKADGIRYAIPNLDQVVPCQVSPILLAISRDSAQIINVNSGAQIGVPIRHGDRITAAEFSPDGKQFLTTGVDSRVRLWSISGVPIGEPIRQEGSDLKAHFSPDGQRILTMSSGSFPCLWDLSGRRVGEPLERTNLHRWAFSPDGNRLITLSRHENDVKIWNCRSAVQLGNAITFSSGASNLCISGDGRLVSIALSDGGIGIWEIESSREINRLPDSDGLYGMEFSKDSRQLLVSGSGQIAVFDISGVDNATAILWEIKDAQRAEYSPDGSEVLVTMKYGATLRDAVSGEAIGKPIRLPGNNRKYTFVAEGDYVLAESSCCVQL